MGWRSAAGLNAGGRGGWDKLFAGNCMITWRIWASSGFCLRKLLYPISVWDHKDAVSTITAAQIHLCMTSDSRSLNWSKLKTLDIEMNYTTIQVPVVRCRDTIFYRNLCHLFCSKTSCLIPFFPLFPVWSLNFWVLRKKFRKPYCGQFREIRNFDLIAQFARNHKSPNFCAFSLFVNFRLWTENSEFDSRKGK